ncbi:MAG TPA: tetrathionate reductase family octaheme c-type cytochrome [Candidatus Deferrimicrobium sp.]|nr:tetrathionate reductase family octaheme c-type cytochrome [Candidatus Deferrimicrobium sp.]
MKRMIAIAALLAGSVLASTAFAGNHAAYVGDGPFKNGPEVTRKCMECHERETRDFMKTVHWTWSSEQVVNGKKIELGKKNALNNFCIGLPSNWPRCTSCHAGYGWKNADFDFTKAENVDCLSCHDTTGTYRKFPAGAGHPVYEGETREFPKGKPWPPVDLVKVARSVGAPTRTSCGACHFYGGGGDHIKHGDLDSSMTNPTPEIDVHMGGARKMVCQDCHKSKDHSLKGQAVSVSVGSGPRAMGCADCHKADGHGNAALNRHAKKVACQACHIPTFAKERPTKMWWDWSTAGKDVKPEDVPKDRYGEKTYDRMKGDFRWEKDVVPSYFWYNGSIDRYLAGDRIDPSGVVRLSAAKGNRGDGHARIFPFKLMRGRQAYDSGNNTIAFVNVFGPPGSDAYWAKYDWNAAIAAGMKAAGQPYSGKFGFVETSMVWPVNHMVAPKARALKCADCHGDKGRLDWKALGYKGDPRDPENR